VALRTAIQHPSSVRKLVLVSAPFKRTGWHPEMIAGFDRMGPETAEPMKQSRMYEAYLKIAPRVEDWQVLTNQITTMLKLDYDWTDEVRALPMPVLIVAGDADGLSPRHAVEFFELLGGGKRDAVWDRSGMTKHALAILPRSTHYDIDVVPALAAAVITFLDDPAV
jgi:pimeloyl-ACP methyl ester carboxylesterase